MRQQAHQHTDPDQDREDHRGDPERADPAVVHDGELPFGILAAPEAVDGVGEAVLVEAAGEDHRRHHGKRRGDEGRNVQPDGDDQHQPADRADQHADHGKGAGGAAEVGTYAAGAEPRCRHAGEEGCRSLEVLA